MNDYSNMMVVMAMVVTTMVMVRFRVGTRGEKYDHSKQQYSFHICTPTFLT
jgi:hypothetical protein